MSGQFEGDRIKIKRKKRRNLAEKEADISNKVYLIDREVCSRNYESGKRKSDQIFQFNSGRRVELMEQINVSRRIITQDLYYECLDIYNNNQSALKTFRMTKTNINDILKLEKWFSAIAEPRDPYDPLWSTREKARIKDRISYYCDEDLREIILKERSSS
jgi:hypothetical protein